MSDHRKCDECGEWGWFNSKFMAHRCMPAWECRMETDDDNFWATVRATDAEEAAEKYADEWDCEGGEYYICSQRGEPAVVLVRKPGEQFERWSVEGEMVPHYRACKIESADAESQ